QFLYFIHFYFPEIILYLFLLCCLEMFVYICDSFHFHLQVLFSTIFVKSRKWSSILTSPFWKILLHDVSPHCIYSLSISFLINLASFPYLPYVVWLFGIPEQPLHLLILFLQKCA